MRTLRRIWEILKSPYPADSSLLAVLFYSLGSGMFVFLFFAAFEPFGFFLLPPAPRWSLYIGYGLVTAAAIVLNSFLPPRLWPRFFGEENWSLGRQILWMAWVTLTIGLGCYLLSGAVCAHYGIAAGWVRLRTIVLDTFIIAIFPITVINLANYARLLRRNARVVHEANRRLERLPAAVPPAPEAQVPAQVRIVAANNRDSLRVALDDLLFIQAEENYIRVRARDEKAAPPLLRTSLARVERQLLPLSPRLFRCHRAFMVNMAQIARVEGNAQGLKLALKGTPTIVPVSRRYVGEFRRLIQNL